MAALTSAQLLDWLFEHQFVPDFQRDDLRGQLPSLPDGHALAARLIGRGCLTPYQANQILQGKGEDLILGDYRLLERLGEGAMGQVFKAWNLRLRRVALKMIRQDHVANQKAMDRFTREMQTASRLDHPNIALVRDADSLEGRPFMVMDYVEGIDLSRQVKTHGPLPCHLAAEYARQAALGLQHANERGVVHRDIKPGNLFLTHAGQDGPPLIKILDFGLARFDSEVNAGNRLTQIGNVILGTVDYMAPEQAENARTADTRADIYALGCSLFFLLTGRAPFPGSTIVEKLSLRMAGEPPDVRDLRPDVPGGLATVLLKMMAKRPADRYQTPLEAAQALQPYAQAATVSATPAGQVAVPQAYPAAPDANGVPLARPVAATPPALPAAAPQTAPPPYENPTGDPFAFSHQGTQASVGPPQRVPAGPSPFRLLGDKIKEWWANPVGRKVILGVVGGLLLVILLMVLFSGGSNTPLHKRGYHHPQAKVVIAPLDPVHMNAGEKRTPIIKIERHFFKGPVTISMVNKPEDLNVEPIVIPADKTMGEFRIFTYQHTVGHDKDFKIQAVAENLRDDTMMSLKVVPAMTGKKKLIVIPEDD